MLEEKHREIIEYLHNLCIEKNKSYGNSVSKTYDEYGMVSFLVRIADKLSRANSLALNNQKENDEKLEDTLLDMANYCILAVIELKKER